MDHSLKNGNRIRCWPRCLLLVRFFVWDGGRQGLIPENFGGNLQKIGENKNERNTKFYKGEYPFISCPVCAACAGGVVPSDDVRCRGYACGRTVCHGGGCVCGIHGQLADAADHILCSGDSHGDDGPSWKEAGRGKAGGGRKNYRGQCGPVCGYRCCDHGPDGALRGAGCPDYADACGSV